MKLRQFKAGCKTITSEGYPNRYFMMKFGAVGELLKSDEPALITSLNMETAEIIDEVGFVYDYDYKTIAWSNPNLDYGYIKQLLILHEQEYPDENSNL